MARHKPQRSAYNLVDRVVNKYIDWRASKKRIPLGSDRTRRYFDDKAENAEDREAVHRIEMPWLFRNNTFRGLIRDSDMIENRRLATAPIVQLCIGTVQEKVKGTPWAIIETEQKDKKYLRDTDPNLRTKSFMDKRIKALEDNSKLSKLADMAAMLLSDPNSQHQTFENLVSMILADNMEVGDGVWVLSYAAEDLITFQSTRDNVEKVRPRKGAHPVEIQAMDVLQFNKDLDMKGVLHGYWHVPYEGGVGGGTNSSQVYLGRDEIVWFPNDQRSNRWYGYSETEKARDIIDILLLSMEQEASYFAEGMVSPGALSIDDASQAEIEETIDYYMENIKGHPEKMWLLGKKANWTPFTFNYKDLQFLERKLWDSKSIASLFKLTLSYVGMTPEETNRATAQVEKLVAEDRGIAPRLKFIEYCINTQLIWPFYSKKLSFVFDPIPDLAIKKEMIETAVTSSGGPVLTLNEARSEIGYDDLKDGDLIREQAGTDLDGDFGAGGGGSFDSPDPEIDGDVEDTGFTEVADTGLNGAQIQALKDLLESLALGQQDKTVVREMILLAFPTMDEARVDSMVDSADSFTPDSSGLEELQKHLKGNTGIVDIPTSQWNKLNNDIKKAYRDIFDEIIKELKDFKPDIDDNADKTKAFNSAKITAFISQTIKKNGLVEKIVDSIAMNVAPDMISVMREQSAKLDLELDEDKEERAVRRFIDKRVAEYKEIPESLSETVIQTLKDTMDQGDSFKEAVDRLKILREDFTTHRAETIVRTEIGRSRREAKLMFGETHADLLEKRWVSTKDRRTRKSHRKMDGKTIKMDGKFTVDYSLDNKKQPSGVKEDYPGQSEYGINCRCELELVKKKDV